MLMVGAIPAGYVYFVSLYPQWAEGFSPVQTGLALIPSTVTVVLTATLGTRRLCAALTVSSRPGSGWSFGPADGWPDRQRS